MYLLLAFLLVPLVEIALFIQVGGLIGLWPTLAVVVLTAVIGTVLVRNQGRDALNRLRRSFSELSDPTEPLAHGAMVLVAGALLLTPGFFTDAVGFALLMPPVRVAVLRQLRKRVRVTEFRMGPGPGPRPGEPVRRRPDIIDGDYEDVTPNRGGDRPPSGWTRGNPPER